MAVAMSLGPPPTLIQLQALSLRIFAVNALNIQVFELIKLYGGLEWYYTNLAALLTNNAWRNKCWGRGGCVLALSKTYEEYQNPTSIDTCVYQIDPKPQSIHQYKFLSFTPLVWGQFSKQHSLHFNFHFSLVSQTGKGIQT